VRPRAIFLLVAPFSTLIFWSSEVRGGHGLNAQCPASNENCLARAQMFVTDNTIRGMWATIAGHPGRPCVKDTCDNPGDFGCGGFSAVPIWIVKTSSGHGSSDIFVEMGVVRFSSENGGYPPQIYSFCGNCLSAGGDKWGLHGLAHKGTLIGMWYDNVYNRWGWYIQDGGGQRRVRTEDNPGIGAGSRIDIGGETTDWGHDMGVSSYNNIQVYTLPASNNFTSFSNTRFLATPSGWRSFYLPGDEGIGRYQNISRTSEVIVTSDHHFSHNQDACGQSP